MKNSERQFVVKDPADRPKEDCVYKISVYTKKESPLSIIVTVSHIQCEGADECEMFLKEGCYLKDRDLKELTGKKYADINAVFGRRKRIS